MYETKKYILTHMYVALGTASAAEYQKREEVTLSWQELSYSLKVKGKQVCVCVCSC